MSVEHAVAPTAAPSAGQDDGAPVHVARAHTRTIVCIALGLACVFGAALIAGARNRAATGRELADRARRSIEPSVVDIVRPQPATAAPLALAGTTQALTDSVIYARTSGYLSKRYVDIGDNVKAGQLLAEIESPEVDQQLIQARAQLQQSVKNLELQEATLDIARVTMNRYQSADKEGAVAKELVDQQVAAYRTAVAAVAAAGATVDSNKANVQRFEQLTSFERVLAPFDGTVTQRNVDVGALITAGSPTDNTAAAPTRVTGAASGIFQVSQVETLRVFVNVPQVYAPNMKPGLPAQVRARGQFAAPVAAKVTRTANALDPGTRTLLTEVDVPNASRALFPGMFVYVDFSVAPAGTRFRVPATAVIANAQGTQVMLVTSDGALHVRSVVLGRDFGDVIDVQAGLDGSEQIVKQPTVSLQEGQHVTPREPTSGAN